LCFEIQNRRALLLDDLPEIFNSGSFWFLLVPFGSLLFAHTDFIPVLYRFWPAMRRLSRFYPMNLLPLCPSTLSFPSSAIRFMVPRRDLAIVEASHESIPQILVAFGHLWSSLVYQLSAINYPLPPVMFSRLWSPFPATFPSAIPHSSPWSAATSRPVGTLCTPHFLGLLPTSSGHLWSINYQLSTSPESLQNNFSKPVDTPVALSYFVR
jgi:hypothetical protein